MGLDCFGKKDNDEQERKGNEIIIAKYSNNNYTKLYESQIGFYNAGGSCYMASIIQILIHLRSFIEKFINQKYQKNTLSKLLHDFLVQIINSNKPIEISNFSKAYHKINHKFSGDKGNNPMTFFTEFIKQLEEENKNKGLLDLFTGKNLIKFEGLDEADYDEVFIFFMITLDKDNTNIVKAINKEKEMEDDKNVKIIEKIVLKPEIFIINLEVDGIDYSFEEEIFIDEIKYELKGINEYNDFHSTV